MLKRELYLKKIRGFYDSNLIKILVGIKRCGKTTILGQIIDELKIKNVDNKHIIYINFEYLNEEKLLDYKKLYEYIKIRIKDDKIYYIFLDEIQLVENFEKPINSLIATLPNVSIFITGSNSRLLYDELSTILSGKYVSFKIYPLSFKEVIEYLKIDNSIDIVFDDFLKRGSLPNRFQLKNENDIKNYLHDVFNSIIFKDIVLRFKIRDIELLTLILQYLLDTIGNEFSAKDLVNYLNKKGKTVSTQTIYTYLEALRKSFLISKIYRCNIKTDFILKTLNKYYLTDLGILILKTGFKEIKTSSALENIVYNDLLAKGYKVYIGKIGNDKIDFVAKKYKKILYIQVALTLKLFRTNTSKNFNSFDRIKDNYPKYVITLDKDKYEYNGIKHINIIDFLLADDL